MAPDKMDKKDISSFMKFICKTLNSYKVKEKKKEEKKNEKKK